MVKTEKKERDKRKNNRRDGNERREKKRTDLFINVLDLATLARKSSPKQLVATKTLGP